MLVARWLARPSCFSRPFAARTDTPIIAGVVLTSLFAARLGAKVLLLWFDKAELSPAWNSTPHLGDGELGGRAQCLTGLLGMISSLNYYRDGRVSWENQGREWRTDCQIGSDRVISTVFSDRDN